MILAPHLAERLVKKGTPNKLKPEYTLNLLALSSSASQADTLVPSDPDQASASGRSVPAIPQEWPEFVDVLRWDADQDREGHRDDLVGRALLFLDALPSGKQGLLVKDYSSGNAPEFVIGFLLEVKGASVAEPETVRKHLRKLAKTNDAGRLSYVSGGTTLDDKELLVLLAFCLSDEPQASQMHNLIVPVASGERRAWDARMLILDNELGDGIRLTGHVIADRYIDARLAKMLRPPVAPAKDWRTNLGLRPFNASFFAEQLTESLFPGQWLNRVEVGWDEPLGQMKTGSRGIWGSCMVYVRFDVGQQVCYVRKSTETKRPTRVVK